MIWKLLATAAAIVHNTLSFSVCGCWGWLWQPCSWMTWHYYCCGRGWIVGVRWHHIVPLLVGGASKMPTSAASLPQPEATVIVHREKQEWRAFQRQSVFGCPIEKGVMLLVDWLHPTFKGTLLKNAWTSLQTQRQPHCSHTRFPPTLWCHFCSKKLSVRTSW